MSKPEGAPRLLVIDTAGPRCVAAAFDGVIARAIHDEAMARGHAERLFPLIAAALDGAGWSRGMVDALVVCTGPGGFAGARIGVAAARGLALALRRPAIGVDWFEALAGGITGPALVSFEAPGGMAWVQRFSGGAPPGPVATLRPDDPRARTQAGEAALGEADRDAAGPAALAAAGLARLRGAGSARPAPLYLRPPDATPPAPGPAVRRGATAP